MAILVHDKRISRLSVPVRDLEGKARKQHA